MPSHGSVSCGTELPSDLRVLGRSLWETHVIRWDVFEISESWLSLHHPNVAWLTPIDLLNLKLPLTLQTWLGPCALHSCISLVSFHRA